MNIKEDPSAAKQQQKVAPGKTRPGVDSAAEEDAMISQRSQNPNLAALNWVRRHRRQLSAVGLALLGAAGVSLTLFLTLISFNPKTPTPAAAARATNVVAPVPEGWKTYIDPTQEFFLYYPETYNQKPITLFQLSVKVPVDEVQTLVLTDNPGSTMQYSPPAEALRVMVWKNPGKSLTFDEWVVSMSVGEASTLKTETVGKCIASSAAITSKNETILYRWLNTHIGYLGLMVQSKGSGEVAKAIAASFISASCIGNP